MLDANGLKVRKIVTESQKAFILKCLSFENGLFILLAEGVDRIGSLAVSITASNKSTTATVIPSKYHSVFINTISEKVSSMINGICIVSFYTTNQLNLNDMKAIMGEIMNIVEDIHIGDDRKAETGHRR
jgi:hypothetical protein